MRRTDIRWLVVLVANLLVVWLTGAANHHLSSAWFPFSDHFSARLYLGGLLVTYPALRLDPRNGLVATLLTGLCYDALAPLPFGTHAVLFALVHVSLLRGRQRFPREEVVFSMVVALLANLFLFLTLSFFLVGAAPRPGEAWLRLFSDLICSQLVIAAITPWFLALQNRTFDLLGTHPETGRRAAL